MAAAYAACDGTKAAATLRLLRHSIPVVRVLVGKERMSLYDYALFGAAETSALNPLREDVFVSSVVGLTLPRTPLSLLEEPFDLQKSNSCHPSWYPSALANDRRPTTDDVFYAFLPNCCRADVCARP